jgi:hypothetical protein
MIRSASCLVLALLAPVAAVAQAGCPGPDGIRSGALTGTWRVGGGAAQVGGSPMLGGSDEVVIQSTGGGVTLTIERVRISLNRVPAGTAGWTWVVGNGIAITPEEFGIVALCPNEDMTRFEGTMVIEGQTVTWRLMVESETEAYVYWTFPGPPPADGIFPISK